MLRNRFLTQTGSNEFMVLKAAPTVVGEADIENFVISLPEMVELLHTTNAFWSECVRTSAPGAGHE
ncbi:MAG TPA: hypothetical protein VF786_06865 [Terriglobales bacterium]